MKNADEGCILPFSLFISRGGMPNWQDVRWNHGAAEAAGGALRRAADEVERAAGERARAAAEAVVLWNGAHRRDFDERLAGLLAAARDLAAELRAAAAAIGHASQLAREEQARREREREQWERERREERARERARQEEANRGGA
jgi:uncharacterized protein YukE